MKKNTLTFKQTLRFFMLCTLITSYGTINAQTLAFPEAMGFGRYTVGARGYATPQIYNVTNLNDSGTGSFRDAVSQPGRFVIFKVGGVINVKSTIAIAANTTIAGQTAPGEGIVLLSGLGAKVSFSGSNNTISRYIRIRYGAAEKGMDASGIANGANMILDHMSFSWGTDEVFSINSDGKGTSPDNITLQNCIFGQGLHRHNHSAAGLIQPPDGGKVSLIGNLYICNKTRNNKVKGINEYVNNVVYNWGNMTGPNPDALPDAGEAYIMGGDSDGISNVNIINNYFITGPDNSASTSTPFSRGNINFFLYGSGNYFDNNRDGVLNGALVPNDLSGYPTGDITTILSTPYDYPMKNTTLSAEDAFNKVVASAGASYPSRDQVDALMISDLTSKGTKATAVYVQTDLTKAPYNFINGGAGHIYGAPAPLDTDNDGMPDAWEDANGLNKNVADALAVSTAYAPYLNIEVYINGLINVAPAGYIIPPSNVAFTNVNSVEVPPSSSLTVNWNDDATNEDSYVVERSTNGTTYTVIATLPANTTSYGDSGLVPNTLYYYRVKATNATSESVYTTVSVTTPPIPSAPTKAATPTPATGYKYVELTNTNLTLKWTGSTNTTTYAVYFGTDPLNLAKVADVAYVAAPTYQLLGLNTGATYYWRIDAANAKGIATGDVWSFTTLTPSLVGYWPFKEAALEGEKITDLSSYANDGLLDVAYDNSNVRVAGKRDNALDLATSSSTMYLASIPSQDHILFDKNSFTVSFWMKAPASILPASSSPTSLYVLCKGSITKNATTGSTGKRFDIEVKGGLLRFAIDDDVTKKEVSTSATPFFTDKWVNVVLMRDVIAHRIRIYTNGALSAELDETAVTGIGEDSDFVIGNIGELEFKATTNTPAPYKGAFDELKMFNYALTAPEVSALFAQASLSTEKFTQNKVGTVYPNPVKDKIFINIPNCNESSVTATLIDATGKVVLKEKIVANGNGQFTLNVGANRISGIYLLNILGEQLNSNFKIIAE